jgi:hypothetical protein
LPPAMIVSSLSIEPVFVRSKATRQSLCRSVACFASLATTNMYF